MNAYKEAIWNRGDAREIMREARRRFRVLMRDSEFEHTPDPHVALASTHYSLVKRYKKFDPRAIWHAWRAAKHANAAANLDAVSHYKNITPDQADVLSTILTKVPKPLGGSLSRARSIARVALHRAEEMLPHTYAFLILRLAEIDLALGFAKGVVLDKYIRAKSLKESVLSEEDKVMAKRQWCRIASAIGLFYIDILEEDVGRYADDRITCEGEELLVEALRLSREVLDGRQLSRDQELKILIELRNRGIKESDLASWTKPDDWEPETE
ncbi:hypothetical protein KW796_02530 [Candidatus Parcubacteria bacterium]|nr:hypothetical protein [Candidatus Parcubacteria bacterium]